MVDAAIGVGVGFLRDMRIELRRVGPRCACVGPPRRARVLQIHRYARTFDAGIPSGSPGVIGVIGATTYENYEQKGRERAFHAPL